MSTTKRSWILILGAGGLGVLSVLGGVASGGLFGAGYAAGGLAILLTISVPTTVYVFISLMSLGMAAPYKPLVPRDSLLWSWLNFVGKGSAGVLLLVSGSLIGGLLGSQIASPNGDWAALIGFAAVLVFLWMMVVVALWTVRAVVDVMRLGDQRCELLRVWLDSWGSRNSTRRAKILSLGTEFTAVVLAGFVMLCLLAVGYLALGRVVGFFPPT
ncbi:hypothetical protein NYA9BBAC_02466 [Salinibacterium sp. NYA9b]